MKSSIASSEATSGASAGGWSQVEIAGKTADVYEPASIAEPQFAVIFLHGHGLITLRDNPVYTRELERYGMVAVCPHGQRSWWGEQICQEFDPAIPPARYIREQVLAYIAERWNLHPPRIALLGVSMGGQGALRIAYRAARIFPVVAALAPAVDFQIWHGRGLPLDDLYPTREAARQDTATLLLHPLAWPRHQWLACDPMDVEWFDGVERLASKLSSTGIPFESDLVTSRGGHSWDYFNHMAPRVMQFLHSRLEQEGRSIQEPPR